MGLQRSGVVIGLHRAARPRKFAGDQPLVSIVVAARNEAHTLPELLSSLERLTYPRDRLEILLVDDDSQDDTATVVRHWSGRLPGLRLLPSSQNWPHLNGKARALHTGIAQARGDLILVTDADCCVPPGWVEAHLRFYDEDVVMVGGVTLLDRRDRRTPMFHRLQSLDWLFLTAVGSGAAGLGLPLSVFGTNMSFRRRAYLEIGGYPEIGFSWIEDHALVRAFLRRRPGSRVQLVCDDDIAVHSRAVGWWRGFVEQRKRWAAGAFDLRPVGKVLLALGALSRVVPLVALAAAHTVSAVVALVMLAMSDFAILWAAATKLGRTDLLRYMPIYTVFLPLYALRLLPAALRLEPIVWKGRRRG